MSFKAILFCAQALLIQAISGNCIGAYNGLADGYGWGASPYAAEALAPWGSEWAAPCNAEWAGPWNTGARLRAAEWENAAIESRYGYGINGGLQPATVAASNGGGLAVTSSSPISPNGVSLLSENAIEGPLAVSGDIPFLGAVALEGALPTAGSGGVAYASGNGNVAILNEDFGAYNAGNGYGAYGSGIASGLAGQGFAGQGLASQALASQALAGQALASQGLASGYGAGLAGSYGLNRGCGCGRI